MTHNFNSYLPELTKSDDFDVYWEKQIEKAYTQELNAKRTQIDFPGKMANAYEIEYNGYDDTVIHGFYICPKNVQGKVPCVIFYHGFGGNKGCLHSYLGYINLGLAVVTIDMRGQLGETGDNAKYSSGSTSSVYCKGIRDKNEYYMTKIYLDSVKAIDFAIAQPEVDESKIITAGGSQGGALSIAVCALDDRPVLCLADVPSNSDIKQRINGEHGSFSTIAEYLRTYPEYEQQAYETVSYIDIMNLSDRIKCRVYASVGMKDNICPAKLFYAAYNRILAPKEIIEYPFNGHEGGGGMHFQKQLKLLDTVFNA